MAQRLSFPVWGYRSRVFEDTFDRFMADGDEGPFDLLLPPGDPVAVQVLAVGQREGLPRDVVLLVQSFYRASRVEALALHLLMVLDSARMQDWYWLLRQHQRLQRIRQLM